MKKNLFMVAAVALMALVSCNKEEINNNEIINDEQIETPSDIVFVAEFDQESDTKIALGEKVDGVHKTTWEAKDKISINGVEFTAKAAGERTEFTTSASFDETATVFRAVYPASSYISTAAVDIPASQNGTFAGASIAVAESSTTSLKFNNLVTILKFQVPVNCSKVTFESTASIAGRITVNYNGGVITPDYAGVTQPNRTINVTGTFVPGTDYYVAVKPDTHTFTVKIDDEVSKASTKAVTVERSKILNMGTLPEPVIPDPVYVYVKNDMGWSTVNIYGWEKSNDKNKVAGDWPGTKMSATETINGTSFFKFEIPSEYVGKEIGLIFNNGTKQLSDYFTTLTESAYLRLTPGTPIVVNPNDKSSFKYRVYVYDQAKKKNVNIYYWGVTGAPGWPGTKITNYVDYDYKSLGYFEIPAEAYNGKTFNYLLNVNGDELKTGDLSVTNPTSDLFIGYWNNSGGKGFWMNGTKPYTNADACK